MAEFKEYPKRVYPNGPDKPSVRVMDEAEEAAVLKSAPKAGSKPKAPAAPGAPDRKTLIARAKDLGIKKANFMSTADLLAAVHGK